LASAEQVPSAMAGFVALDAEFHAMFVRLSKSAVLARHLEPDLGSPYASGPVGNRIATDPGDLLRLFRLEQEQHRAIVIAISDGDGERAEALVRDHAALAARLDVFRKPRPGMGAAASL